METTVQLPIDLLKTFVFVVETASFTKAGELVNRSQSAVSQQMHRLEEIAGRKLVERNGRTVRPTPQGEELLAYARRMLKLHDEAVTALSRPEISGVVRLGAADDYASSFLPDVLSRFACCHPMVQVEMHCDASVRLQESLLRGELDLVIYADGDIPEGADIICKEPLRWVTSPQHAAHEERPLPLVVYDQDCIYRKWATSALDRAGVPYRVGYVSRSLAGIQAAVKAGLAVGVLGAGSVPAGALVLGKNEGFPDLPEATQVLLRGANRSEPVESLARKIIEGFRTRLTEAGCAIPA